MPYKLFASATGWTGAVARLRRLQPLYGANPTASPPSIGDFPQHRRPPPGDTRLQRIRRTK